MSLHRGRFVVVLALSLVVVFSGCHKPGMAGAQSIVLTAPNGNCLQNGAAGLVQIDCGTASSQLPICILQLPDRYRIAVYRDCECGYTRWH